MSGAEKIQINDLVEEVRERYVRTHYGMRASSGVIRGKVRDITEKHAIVRSVNGCDVVVSLDRLVKLS